MPTVQYKSTAGGVLSIVSWFHAGRSVVLFSGRRLVRAGTGPDVTSRVCLASHSKVLIVNWTLATSDIWHGTALTHHCVTLSPIGRFIAVCGP